MGLPPPAPKQRRKQQRQAPQETVQLFWDRLNPKYPGKVLTVLPNNPYARKKAAKTPRGVVHGQRAAKSYEEARSECTRDVDRIIKECRRLNQKYRDAHFDIEWDLKSGQRNCLDGLSTTGDSMKPKGVKRVTVIALLLVSRALSWPLTSLRTSLRAPSSISMVRRRAMFDRVATEIASSWQLCAGWAIWKGSSTKSASSTIRPSASMASSSSEVSPIQSNGMVGLPC